MRGVTAARGATCFGCGAAVQCGLAVAGGGASIVHTEGDPASGRVETAANDGETYAPAMHTARATALTAASGAKETRRRTSRCFARRRSMRIEMLRRVTK